MVNNQYALGKREQVGVVEELGGFKDLGGNTMASNGFIPGYNITVSPDFSDNWQEILNNGEDSSEVKDMEQGPLSLPFTMKFNPYNWWFLKYCVHSTVTNDDQGPYNEHTWTKEEFIKTFQVEWAKRMNTNQVITLTGVTIKSYRLSWNKGTGANDGFVEVELECVASGYSDATSVTTIAAPTATAFRFFNQKFTYESGEVVEVNSGEIRVNNGVNDENSRYCNYNLDRELGEPISEVKRYGFTMNVNEKDNGFFSSWTNSDVLSGTNTIELQAGTNNFISFQLNEVRLGTAPAGPTNLQGVSAVDLVGIPLSLTITGEDDFEY